MRTKHNGVIQHKATTSFAFLQPQNPQNHVCAFPLQHHALVTQMTMSQVLLVK